MDGFVTCPTLDAAMGRNALSFWASPAFLGLSIRQRPTLLGPRAQQRNILVLPVSSGARASVAERHVIITGANSGIGKATALELAKKGMVVTLACRNKESGKAAAREIAQASNNASVRKKSRVVVLSSAAERLGQMDFTDLNYKGSRVYNNWGAYGQSKLANCLFSYELARRSRKLGLPIISSAMHPGIVNTNLIRYVFPNVTRMGELPPIVEGLARSFFRLWGLKTPEEGASTAIFLASSPEVENSSGLYYEDSKESTPSLSARNPRLASQLWDVSVELTGASSALEPLGLAKEKATVA